MANIIELTPQEVQDKLNNKEIKLIDIRESIEHKQEHIESSELSCLSEFDEEKTLQKHNCEDSVLVYCCHSGNRTKQFAEKLANLNCTQDIYILKGGITAWKANNYKTIKNTSIKFSLIQQVHIIAGVLILLGVILSVLVNNNFIYLSAFVGAGLLYAGLSGNCMMGMLLAKMPWNK